MAWGAQSYSRVGTNVCWHGQAPTGRVYGTTNTGEWGYTDDAVNTTMLGVSTFTTHGTNWRPTDLAFGGGYMWAIITPVDPSSNTVADKQMGRFYRAPIGDFTGWVDVTPTYWVSKSCGRPAMIVWHNGYILVADYAYTGGAGAVIHRSRDLGETWQVVEPAPTRHMHALKVTPANTLWATNGDGASPPRGIYESLDSGETWQLISDSTQYPINFDFMSDGYFVGEGDGWDPPHVVGFRKSVGLFERSVTSTTWGGAADPWVGSVRGMRVLPDDRVFYVSTGENGAISDKCGVWVATRHPDNTWTTTLLEDLGTAVHTATPPFDYPLGWIGQSFIVGDYLLNTRSRIQIPTA